MTTSQTKAAEDPFLPITIRRGEITEKMFPTKQAALKLHRSAGWLSDMSARGYIRRYRYEGEMRTCYYRESELNSFYRQRCLSSDFDADGGNASTIEVKDYRDKKRVKEELLFSRNRMAELIDKLTSLFIEKQEYERMSAEYANETVRYKRLEDELRAINAHK